MSARCDLWLLGPSELDPSTQPPTVLTGKEPGTGSYGNRLRLWFLEVMRGLGGQDRCSSGQSSVFRSPCSLDMDLTLSTVGAETSSLGV